MHAVANAPVSKRLFIIEPPHATDVTSEGSHAVREVILGARVEWRLLRRDQSLHEPELRRSRQGIEPVENVHQPSRRARFVDTGAEHYPLAFVAFRVDGDQNGIATDREGAIPQSSVASLFRCRRPDPHRRECFGFSSGKVPNGDAARKCLSFQRFPHGVHICAQEFT